MGLLDFIIHIGVDAASAHKGFDSLGTKVSAISSHIGSRLAATFSVAAVAGFVEHTAMAALETRKLAEELGTTAEWIEKIERLSAKKHIDPESVFGALGRAEKFMGDALGEGKGAEKKMEILKSLGLGLKDISGEGANAMNVLLAFGRSVDAVGATLEQRQVAREIFGRRGARIANLLKDLPGQEAKFTPEQREAAEEAGETIEHAEKFVKRQMTLGAANAIKSLSKDAKTWHDRAMWVRKNIYRIDDTQEGMGGALGRMMGGGSGPFGAMGMAGAGASMAGEQPTGPIYGPKTLAESIAATRGAGTGMQPLALFGDKRSEADKLASIGTMISKPVVPKTEVFQDKSLVLQERTAKTLDEINDKIDDGIEF